MKIGDSVSVIDENLNGVVRKMDQHSVAFEDQHGFMHHYPRSKVISRAEDWSAGINADYNKSTDKVSSKPARKSTFTLDIHFDKLKSGSKNYDAAERIALQREKVLEAIDYCKISGIRKLEIIHGIGDGTLQKMVRDNLEAKGMEFYDNALYLDQSGSVTVFL